MRDTVRKHYIIQSATNRINSTVINFDIQCFLLFDFCNEFCVIFHRNFIRTRTQTYRHMDSNLSLGIKICYKQLCYFFFARFCKFDELQFQCDFYKFIKMFKVHRFFIACSHKKYNKTSISSILLVHLLPYVVFFFFWIVCDAIKFCADNKNKMNRNMPALNQ